MILLLHSLLSLLLLILLQQFFPLGIHLSPVPPVLLLVEILPHFYYSMLLLLIPRLELLLTWLGPSKACVGDAAAGPLQAMRAQWEGFL